VAGTTHADEFVAANLQRLAALSLQVQVGDVALVGSVPSALARALAGGEARVTIIDGAEAESAARLPRESQDVVVLAGIVERLPSAELRWLLQSCRSALRPDGVCLVLSVERFAAPSARKAFEEDAGVSLFEVGVLRGLVAEAFEAVDVFTWNGIERSDEPGKFDDLVALAWAGTPYVPFWPGIAQFRAADVANSGWIAATVADDLVLPTRFLLRASLYVRAAPADAVIHFVFRTGDPARLLWIPIRPSTLVGSPASLLLASELLTAVGGASVDEVTSIVMRIRSPSGGPCDVRLADLRLMTHQSR
jgi:hypothetical protein